MASKRKKKGSTSPGSRQKRIARRVDRRLQEDIVQQQQASNSPPATPSPGVAAAPALVAPAVKLGHHAMMLKGAPGCPDLTAIRPGTRLLRFSAYAWAQLLSWRDFGPTEVGALGIAYDLQDLLSINELFFPPQKCSSTLTEFDDAGMARACYLIQQSRGVHAVQCQNVWLHTHPGTSPSPSATDEETFRDVFGNRNWCVMLISAREGWNNIYCRLRCTDSFGSVIREIPVIVDFTLPGPPGASVTPDAWYAEYKQVVTHSYSSPGIYGGGHHRSTGYSGDYPGNSWYDQRPSSVPAWDRSASSRVASISRKSETIPLHAVQPVTRSPRTSSETQEAQVRLLMSCVPPIVLTDAAEAAAHKILLEELMQLMQQMLPIGERDLSTVAVACRSFLETMCSSQELRELIASLREAANRGAVLRFPHQLEEVAPVEPEVITVPAGATIDAVQSPASNPSPEVGGVPSFLASAQSLVARQYGGGGSSVDSSPHRVALEEKRIHEMTEEEFQEFSRFDV